MFLWTLLLLAASQWEFWCAHTTYDRRASTPGCVRLKNADGPDCAAVPGFCAPPHAIVAASPRWLSDLAGMGGPLLTWLPLLATQPAANGPRAAEDPCAHACVDAYAC